MTDTPGGEQTKINWSSFGTWLGILSGLAILAVLMVLWWRELLERDRDEEILTLILATSLVLLIVTFALVALAFRRVRLTDPNRALGLPAGSVRALLAFLLVMIFAMLSIFLFERVGREAQIEGLAAERFQELDVARIVESRVTARNEETGQPTEYAVRLRLDENQAQADLAKQVVTALITLVTALAAFYFGAKTSSTTTDDLVRRALGLNGAATEDEAQEPPLDGHPASEPDESETGVG